MATGDTEPEGRGPSTTLSHRAKSASMSISPPLIDVAQTYRHILSQNPDCTQTVAAIRTLIASLDAQDASTVMEIMDLVRRDEKALLASVRNPVPLRAGTDLFKQFIVNRLKELEDERRDSKVDGKELMDNKTKKGDEDKGDKGFEDMKRQLVRNSEMYAKRAVRAREDAARAGVAGNIVRKDSTVVTFGGSRAVLALLALAGQTEKRRYGKVTFRVVHIHDTAGPNGSFSDPSVSFVADLKKEGVDVKEENASAAEYVLLQKSPKRRTNIVLVGAQAVSHAGGVYARMGTALVASLAKTHEVPFYVVAETHKFVRMRKLPLGNREEDFGFNQGRPNLEEGDDRVDYTYPNHISSFITENGVLSTSYPYEMLLETYGTMMPDGLIETIHKKLLLEGFLK